MMKKRIVSLAVLWVLWGCLNMGVSLAHGDFGRAVVDGKTSDRVHLREGPSTESKSYGLYFTGTEAVLETDPGEEWVLITIGRQTGYMKAEFLYTGNDPGSLQNKQPTAVVKTTGSWVNLRREPNLTAPVESKQYHGDVVTFLGKRTRNGAM